MLSHPANPEPEEAAVATATSQLRKASGNRRRHLTVGEVFGHFDREFFRSWFIDGPRLLLSGRFTQREGAFMALSALPAIMVVALVMLPGYLFHTPQHNAFYHFAQCLKTDSTALIPMVLGTLSSLFSLRFPLAS